LARSKKLSKFSSEQRKRLIVMFFKTYVLNVNSTFETLFFKNSGKKIKITLITNFKKNIFLDKPRSVDSNHYYSLFLIYYYPVQMINYLDVKSYEKNI